MAVLQGPTPEEYLSVNLSVVANRWPHLAKRIEKAGLPRSVVLLDGVRLKTLRIDGLHLGSRYDRERDAAIQASFIPQGSRRASIYGPGLGDLPRVLLRRSEMANLSIVLMNLAVTRAVFSHFDCRDWLADPRVDILTAEEVKSVGFPFASVSPCLQLAAPESLVLRDEVMLEIATPFIRRKHGAANPQLQHRMEQTRRFWSGDPCVTTLFDRRCGTTVHIAAAGPTLKDAFERLARRPVGEPLIAVDAALRPLLKAGLPPDIVVSIDADETVFQRFFQDNPVDCLKETALVYFPVSSPRILEEWSGPRLAAVSSSPLYAEVARERPLGNLFSAGSVLHPAVDLAVRMGAARVVFAGADFSFPGGESHVHGSGAVPFMVKPNVECLVSGTGESVATTPSLRGYLRDLERYVAAHPEVEFQASGRRGAVKRGVEWID